ncbi:MAG: beta-galactosidase [Ginsengibacter sp.]
MKPPMKVLNITFLLFCTFNLFAQNIIAPISATVAMYEGKPTIMLNGLPQNPMLYALTDVPGGRWSWEELPKHTMRSFCDQGFNLIQVDLAFDQVWKEDGTINLDTAQMQLRGVLNICPHAAIMIRFHVNAPKWWQHKFPEENTVYADTIPKPDYNWGMQRIIEDDEETPQRFSLASKKWLAEAGEKLKIFLQQLKQMPEANAIAAIQVVSGVYGEWHYWGFINNEPDMSGAMQEYFKKWLKERYHGIESLQKAWGNKTVTFDNAAVPSLEQRRTTFAGIFRDPQKERNVIDYYEAQHNCVADDIIYFSKLVKENWPRPIITGAFYGYFYSVFGREAAGGHLALQKVLQSPYIDFLSAPNTYYPDSKETGEPYRSRSLINSVTLHGKLWLDEMDQQPPLLHFNDTAYKTSVEKSIANVRRNILFTFTKGAGLWFYDFGPSGFNGGSRLNDHGSWGWWDDPNLMKDIGRVKKLLDEKINTPYKSGADVLLVHDTRSFYYTGSAKATSYMGHWANNWIPPAIFKSGVVHDVIHIDDLDKVNLVQYKAVVFVNTWVLNDAQKKFIREKVASGNRHLIFLYAPGYSNESELNKSFIESVTGIQVQQIDQKKTTTVVVNDSIVANYSYSVWNNAVNPFFVISDKKALALGSLKDSGGVALARKEFPNHTSWLMSLPPSSSKLWRYVFQQADAHIYDTDEDIFYSGHGVLSIHTLKGGKRNIQLKNGTTLQVSLPANATVLLDSETGKLLLE